MADFCTKCSPQLFGEETKPDIDILEIAEGLQPGYYTKTLCEGCGMVAILKEEDGTIKVGLLPEDQDREDLDLIVYEDFMKMQSKF